MPSYNTEIIVLRTHLLGEADKILVCLSPDKGKFSIVSKGCRRPKSRFAAVSQLFSHSEIQGQTGKNLDILTQAEILDIFGGFRNDAPALAWAQYAVELVDISTPEHQAAPDIFMELLSHLKRLENSGNCIVFTRAFELRLLTLLGYEPGTSGCSICGNGLGSSPAILFNPSAGGAVCGRCEDRVAVPGGIKISIGALQYMKILAKAESRTLTAIRINQVMGLQLEEAVVGFLAYHLDRLPKSLEFARVMSAGDA